MRYIGAHVSAAGGVFNAPLNAAKIGANAFALFTKNQRQWSAKELSDSEIEQFKANLKASGISAKHVLPHSSYLINLGHPDEEARAKSLEVFIDEIDRASKLGLKLLNFHPGSHLKQISEKECLDNIVSCMNVALKRTSGVKLVIENTAAQGSNLGFSFKQIAYLIERVDDDSRVGVCFDTCHAFAAGYDLRSKEAYAKTMGEFDAIIGYKFLSGMHLNDAKFALGSKKDRHESLGKGELGFSAFKNIINDDKIGEIPLILEIKILRNLEKEKL